MKKKYLWMLFAILAIVCSVSVLTCNNNKEATLSVSPTDNSSEFVTLTDVVPDAILEIRYYGTYNFVGQRIDGYEEPIALLTKQAAKALKEVSDDVISQGYRLKIYDAYRPQKGVDHFVRWAQDISDIKMKPYFYPDLDKSVLFEQEYIYERSGHTRGSTVDLTLFDMNTEKDLDMGGTFGRTSIWAERSIGSALRAIPTSAAIPRLANIPATTRKVLPSRSVASQNSSSRTV